MKKDKNTPVRKKVKLANNVVLELVQIALLELQKDFTAAYEKAEKNEYKKAEGDWSIWGYCTICGEALYILPNDNAHNALIDYMKEHGWGHKKCLE